MLCPECKKEYVKTGNNQKFCTIECRDKNRSLRIKEKWKNGLIKKQSPIYAHNHYLKNKDKIIKRTAKNIKEKALYFKTMLGAKCSICGYDKCLSALEFHHIEGKKDYDASRGFLSLPKKKILEDIKNHLVILLCANCHREQHSKDNS
jgi:hypothetical protein